MKAEPLSLNARTMLPYPMSLEFLQGQLRSWSDASRTVGTNVSAIERFHLVEESVGSTGIQASATLASVFGTKSRASKACKEGQVLLNGIKIYGTRKVFQGDQLLLRFPLDQGSGLNSTTHTPGSDNSSSHSEAVLLQEHERLLSFVNHFLSPVRNPPMHVLYEDDDIAVVFKPAGVHSLAYLGTSKRNLYAFDDTLPVILSPPSSQHSPNTSPDATTSSVLPRPLPCHRLDSRVAGCLVAAKSKRAMAEMTSKFEARAVMKEYRAVLAGALDPAFMAQFIDPDAKLSSLFDDSNDENASVGTAYNIYFDVDGRPAHTELRVLDVCQCNVYGQMTLVALFPHTGRRHQLRQHCAILGCPMIGDDLYHDIAYLPTVESRLAALSSLKGVADIDVTAETEGESIEEGDQHTTEAKIKSDEEECASAESVSTGERTTRHPRVRRGVGLFLASVGVAFDHPIEGASKRISVQMYKTDQTNESEQGQDQDQRSSCVSGTPPRFLRLMEKAAKGNQWTMSRS